jgi:methylated-DNA-[protein]-cysteine S-methyltransferase
MKQYCFYQSPLGTLLLMGRKGIIEKVYFPNGKKKAALDDKCVEDKLAFSEAATQLDEYFQGKRKNFELALNPEGTDFQQQVWKELQRVGYGETACYQEIAERIGNPRACRAVGMANGKNPIPIIIPCHRIIGKDGSLTGFGGGLKIKKQLLELEQKSL